MTINEDHRFSLNLARRILRDQVKSALYATFCERKRDGLTSKGLAEKLGKDKAEVSKWWSGEPNWTLNTVSDIAEAMNTDVVFLIRDKVSGKTLTASGEAVVVLPAESLVATDPWAPVRSHAD